VFRVSRSPARSIDAVHPVQHAVLMRARFRSRAERAAAVDRLVVSAAVRQRLRVPELDRDGAALAEAALRQWFRLLAARPRARLAMPSRLADALWAELARDTREYAAFCAAAFGRIPDRTPRTAATAAELAARDPGGMLATLGLARLDEGRGPAAVPVLFRADQEAGLDDNRYVGDCGARGDCHARVGVACLHHIVGIERRPVRAILDERGIYGARGANGG
jgi:hypothetical protein